MSSYKLDLPNFNPIIRGICPPQFSLHLKKCIKSINQLGFVIAVIQWFYKCGIDRKQVRKLWALIFMTSYCVFILINWKGSLCSKVEYYCLWVFHSDIFFIRGSPMSICESTHTMFIVSQLSECNCWTLVIAKPMELFKI